MAAVTNHSPRSSGGGDTSAALSSPKSTRGAAARDVAFPWTLVVRGAESEAIVSSSVPPAAAAALAPPSPPASAPSQGAVGNSSSPDWSPTKAAAATSTSSFSLSPDDSAAGSQLESHNNVNAAKKPAWNKPSNGGLEVGPVMGAVSWPALSESTRASPKSSSSDSLKALSDGSILVSQGTGIASSSSQKQVITNNTSPGSTPNHATPTRQKSMKRVSGSSSVTANGGFSQPPLAPGSAGEMPSNNNSGRPGPAVPESSSRDHIHKDGGPRGGFGSQSHGGNDHPPHRNSFRRGNVGPHSRGDGSYHHSYGGRRDQDRGNHDWNSHRSFNGRDAHMQPPRGVPRNFIRPPPPSSAPFIPHPPVPVRPFGNPMVYPEMASPVIYVPAPPPDSLRGVPIVAPMPPHAMFFPVMDPQLHARIVNQIDYYFSNENLIKDTFLRLNMDEEGWVPIKLISGFKKVMILTDNIQLILDAVRTSSVLEVQGDKVRRRNDWRRWIMPPSVQFPTVSSPQSIGRASHDMLPTNIQSLSLEEKTNKQGQAEVSLSRSLSGDLNSHFQPQATVEAGSERAISARSSSK